MSIADMILPNVGTLASKHSQQLLDVAPRPCSPELARPQSLSQGAVA